MPDTPRAQEGDDVSDLPMLDIEHFIAVTAFWLVVTFISTRG